MANKASVVGSGIEAVPAVAPLAEVAPKLLRQIVKSAGSMTPLLLPSAASGGPICARLLRQRTSSAASPLPLRL
jgi:hypothetical protein